MTKWFYQRRPFPVTKTVRIGDILVTHDGSNAVLTSLGPPGRVTVVLNDLREVAAALEQIADVEEAPPLDDDRSTQ